MNYLLGIDLGSTRCKSTIIDENGNIISNHSIGYPTYSPYTGWSEQNPDDWWNATVESVKSVIEKSKINSENIICIGLSGQMHGLVPVDINGKVLRNAIIWDDQRTNVECKEIVEKVGGINSILKYINNNIHPGYTVSKLLWIKKNEPEVYHKIYKILNPKDYIRLCLTDEYATDVSDASGTGLFDVRRRKWSDEILRILGINEDVLPKCYESAEITGYLKEEAANVLGLPKMLPVVAGGGNAVVQLIGMGLVEAGDIGVAFGTSGRVAILTDKVIKNNTENLQIFCGNKSDMWICMGVTLAAIGSYNWFTKHMCKWEEAVSLSRNIDFNQFFEQSALQSPPGCKNLIFLPYLIGERCPYTDTYAKGAFIGLTNKHNNSDMLRSTIEGIVYNLKQILETIMFLDEAFVCKDIILSGGEVVTDLWYQILSDTFQLPVKKVNTEKVAAAYGAAILAGVGCNVFKNLKDVKRFIKVETEFFPNKNHKLIYENLYKIYKSLYPLLRETNIKLHIL